MISLNNVTVSYGSFTLLDDVSVHISESDKIGLVGKNGAGKSTMPAEIRIGYLPQIMEHHRGRSVIDEVMTVFDHLHEMERELERINGELAERTDYESAAYARLIDRLNEINDRLALETGESPRVQAERTLFGLGFKAEELDRHTETFSQGWNMRIELAKVLLAHPDVLLLDEPTNHLDIESIEWFEDYLKSFRGSLLLVSHDRKFLDNVTTRTVEILLGHIHDYKVPYSFINRFRYKPTKSNQVQSRIKALEKLDRIEIDETDDAKLNLRFPPAARSGDVVFKGTDLTVGYPQKVVFRDAEIEIKRGEKVALIGRNGEGKTTLMRVIMGELEPFSGEAKVGHNVHIGYYAQNQEDILDRNETVFGTLDRIAVGEIRTKLRDLGMAKLMLSPYNVLALDEPTNHMDIRSKDRLKQALQAFDGTLIVVSHDRDFLEGLVDKLYEFRDGKVKEHLGGVADFLRKRKLESLQELERLAPVEKVADDRKVQAQETFQARKTVSKEIRKIQNRVDYLEKEIGKLEKRQAAIEQVLAAPGPQDDVMELTRDYLENKRSLDAFTEEWSLQMEKLEN